MTQTGIRIQPIKTDQDHAAAIARIEHLMDNPKTAAERDELDILVTLVDAYENIHFPIAPPEPLAAIQFHMEHMGVTRKDLEQYIGSRARVSEVLSGKRPLTLAMVRRLKAGLGISADTLIGATPRSRTPRKKSSAPTTCRPAPNRTTAAS